MNWKDILIIIVLVSVVGALFAYEYWWEPKKESELSEEITQEPPIPTEKPTEEEKPAEISGEVKPSCKNECSETGIKKCSDNGYQICGNYDEDECLEWSLITNCPTNSVCQNGDCVSTPIVQCSSGPCCDISTKKFKPSTHKCQENIKTEYGCPWGSSTGNDVGIRYQHRYCSGSSANCDGALKWGDWVIYKDCASNEACVNGVCKLLIPRVRNVKVAIIEFKYEGDRKVNFSYEFCCDENSCIFTEIPNYSFIEGKWVLQEYNPNWCSKTKIRYTFEDIFNNPIGITKIYPVGSTTSQYTYYSIYKLKEFYKNEAQKYGVDLNVDLDVKGPYILSSKPPQRLRDESPALLEEFFDREAQKYNIDLENYDVINYVYFTSEPYLVGTIYGKKTFNQAIIHFDEFFSSIMSVVHEMGHVFGAGDTYEPGSWSCRYPEGYPEPNKKPLYPQSKACLMCKSIMIEEKYSRAPQDFSELVICDQDARLMEWK